METALDLRNALEKNNSLESKDGNVKYYASDGINHFKMIGNMFLDEKIEDIELVKL